ncbi:MBOAT family O-acyltransferase [Fimbriiglobus ruber]|uniref:Putative poly(Beta-D-mannuronate) O-acetylase n=1 Tax=Fimbriiglobus ruber TaxID=1908690 RepID=A0A225DAE9_9BACT|nr:MBOAT family protein [Fimbriiglobus ruber]OWK35518.1 putative poly(beta-D-mannuronate) O-acetylase [Fimbriiglobus ruber]
MTGGRIGGSAVVFFNSQVFLYLFLPAVLLGYYVVPTLTFMRGLVRRTFLNGFLFAASIFFYAWGEKNNVLILLASLAVNYSLAFAIARDQARDQAGRSWLVAAVAFNLGLLIYYKYTGFLAANASAVWQVAGGTPFTVAAPHLPIGISFFTFQAMSYVIDVYRREVPAQRNFLLFGLYVFLFPHLIAGPIVRYRDIHDQLADRPARLDQFAEGVRRLVFGLAKKLLLADTFARTADAAFALPPGELAASGAWLGVACYSLQIYFDFSGYSDMAIGLGKMFGFDFLENFRYPYASASVTEFWRRWHISLSSWFRDYLYIPLGGNRTGPVRTYLNLLIVFVLCGLWHGANWTFLAWGVYHGLFLIAERLGLGTALDRVWRPLRHVYTLAAVMVGWVFFRADSFAQAAGFLQALAGLTSGIEAAEQFWTGQLAVALAIGLPACLPVVPWLTARKEAWEQRAGSRWAAVGELVASPAVLACVAVLMVGSAAKLAGNTYTAFIYFRF